VSPGGVQVSASGLPTSPAGLPERSAEPPAARRALTAAVAAFALFVGVILQLTAVNRLPLPGSAQPDLVLLLVTAIAVASTPLTGALTGFAGGLAVDVAPPAAHYAGEYALVFCLAGYGAARTVRAIYEVSGERGPLTSFTVMAGAVAAGEAGKAALGMLLNEPDVTAAAVSRVLPAAILYDLALAPLLFWVVSLAARAILHRGAGQELALAPGFSREARLTPVFGNAGSGQVVFRQASLAIPRLHLAGSGQDFTADSRPRRAPKLRLSGSGTNYAGQSRPRRVPELRLSGSGTNYAGQSRPRRVPRLRLAAARSSQRSRTGAAYSLGPRYPLAGGRATRLNFAGDLQLRITAPSRTRSPGKNWLRRAAVPIAPHARRAPRAPSPGWLRASGPGGHGGARAGGRTATAPRGFAGGTAGSAAPLAATPSRSAAEALAARSAPSGVSALSGAGTPLARGRQTGGRPARGWQARGRPARGGRGRRPQSGWLRAHSVTRSWAGAPWAAGRRRSPRHGWLGHTGRASRTVLGSTVYRGGAGSHGPKTIKASAFRGHGQARGNWYTASPSGEWLRRSRNPWRKRRERLLRMVGVGR
jgi:rod shape-determining protein MreD